MSVLEKTLVVSRKQQMLELAKHVSRQIFTADDFHEALDMMGHVDPDLVVFDEVASPHHIQQFLADSDDRIGMPPVVVVTPHPDPPQTEQAYRDAGAAHCLQGHDDLDRLHRIATSIRQPVPVDNARGFDERFFLDLLAARVAIVGKSQATQDELRMIRLVAGSQCNPVLIVGETGTGKEVAARAIHELRHPGRAFVAVNCAALTANLLESELFGHVKGSFTGAEREKTGLFELAGDGTIFLDEISEMPLDLQAKLLRVLQERTFRKVGGTQSIDCRATVVTSSNRNLKDEVQKNQFRRDLYYRLSICPINLAPLRAPKRQDDIPLLADYFLQQSTICPEKQGVIRSLTKLAMQTLSKHDWPGNVRELRNAIERAILLETTDKIGLSSIVIDPDNIDHPAALGVTKDVKDFSLSHAERELIARALKETGWQKTQAASLLGITRATLYAKVKQYCIEREDDPVMMMPPQALAI
jgi:DNA-binding NtrC family response regulator